MDPRLLRRVATPSAEQQLCWDKIAALPVKAQHRGPPQPLDIRDIQGPNHLEIRALYKLNQIRQGKAEQFSPEEALVLQTLLDRMSRALAAYTSQLAPHIAAFL